MTPTTVQLMCYNQEVIYNNGLKWFPTVVPGFQESYLWLNRAVGVIF